MTDATLTVAFVQATPLHDDDPVATLNRQLDTAMAKVPNAGMVVFPEMHLFGAADNAPEGDAAWYRRHAVTLPGSLTQNLSALARRHRIWLVPGTVPEHNPVGEPFNTALVFSPDGELVHRYRKVFPWRPSEQWTPGHNFSIFEVPPFGRFGITICYDSWYPEVTRQLAWLGADTVLNLVKTTTPDRAQELILARANAITNQVYYLSVNAAGPDGVGHSIFVDPNGDVLDELPDASEHVIAITLQRSRLTEIRRDGTAGMNRLWAQFRPTDPPIEFPAYDATVAPQRWNTHLPPGEPA